MDSKNIKSIVEQFENKDTYKKIFINGAWGIGKSFYIEEYRKEHPNNIVYISLFGKNSFDSIEDAIAVELMNKLNNFQKASKKIIDVAKKIKGSISYNGISISSPSIEKKNLFKNYSKLLQDKKLIIVIDDLERKSCNTNIEDIMGLIEQFSQYDNIKVLIIGSEENMENDDLEKWRKFKEKIIEKEYDITSFSEDAIESLVIGRLKDYIPHKELKVFIKEFLEKHKTKNLRSVEKGVNLFLEVIENYLKKKYNPTIYISILKNCMAVAIEFSEQLYKPQELTEEEKGDFSKSLTYSTDEDIYTRIISHYFHSILITKKESAILEYIISFYNGQINDTNIENFNNTVENYLNKKEEKNIFYLSEEEIISKIKKLYEQISKNEYSFSTIDQLIEDFNEMITWNNNLNLKLDKKMLSKQFNKILFDNYYSLEKEQYQNTIDSFELKRYNSKELDELIIEYNNNCIEKYTQEKLDSIINEYKEKNYNTDKLQWLDWSLIQENKDIIKQYIMKDFKANNYLIPDLSKEISEQEWKWTHNIWKIYYERFSQEEKIEINKEIEKMKITLLSSSRISSLQEYRPLLIKENQEIEQASN